MSKEPVLQYPDFNATFKLTLDVSEYAIGAILTQEKDNVYLLVTHYSKILNSNEQKYPMAEKECLGILYAMEHFRPYLYGRDFILACDFEPVHWMTYIENPEARIQRWRIRMQNYQYKFECEPRKINRIVEALSNNPVDHSGEPKDWSDLPSSDLENVANM